MNSFDVVMEHIFQWEGGYVDHPRDPGGVTNMGITINTLSHWFGRPASKEEVKALTKEEAKKIYKKRYWNAVKAKQYPDGLNLVMMDAAVNSGPRAAVRWLQRALGVSDDGRLGPVTLDAVRASQSLSELIDKTVNERLKSVRQFRNYDVFGKGWENRIASTLTKAQEMARANG